jgi:hypothetical protein
MSGNEIKLANGQRWAWQQFLDHYRSAQISGTPTPVGDAPSPVAVDMSWYMSEGPGRYYHPGMFPIINSVANRHDLSPGTYDLWKLAPAKDQDPSVKAAITNYTTDPLSADYKTRSLVFGDESARISGQVIVSPDGTKTFKGIEIQPYDSDFDFQHNNWKRPALEIIREAARRHYDPENRGISYEIP